MLLLYPGELYRLLGASSYIFAGKRKIDHLIDGGLPGTDYTVAESGWSNADVSEEYMKKIML
jgi:hypothetical protein